MILWWNDDWRNGINQAEEIFGSLLDVVYTSSKSCWFVGAQVGIAVLSGDVRWVSSEMWVEIFSTCGKWWRCGTCWGACTEERHLVAPVLAPHVKVSEAIKQPSVATMYVSWSLKAAFSEGLFCIIKWISLGVLQNTSLMSIRAGTCKVCTFNISRPALMFVTTWATVVSSATRKGPQEFNFIQFPWAAWFKYQQIICYATCLRKQVYTSHWQIKTVPSKHHYTK